MYDFTEHIKRKLINKYRGSERKETVILDDGGVYLIKMPDKTREEKRDISYINNAISEYIGCKIMESIGLEVQEVKLGKYKAKSGDGNIKEYIVCACKDFVPDGYALAEAEITMLGSEDTTGAREASFETVRKIARVVDDISEAELTEFYAKLFVADALIGNKDRHNGNWGFITGPEYNKIAPIYDCGSSLCPLLGESELTQKMAKNMADNAMSVISNGNGRIHYRGYIASGINKDVTAALKSLLPNINLNKIFEIIDDTPFISDKRKDFYKDYVKYAYEDILLHSLYLIQKKEVPEITRAADNELYRFYRENLKQIKDLPMFETADITVSGLCFEVMRVSGKFALIIADNTAAGIISVRSNSDDVKETLNVLHYLSGEECSIVYVKDERFDSENDCEYLQCDFRHEEPDDDLEL